MKNLSTLAASFAALAAIGMGSAASAATAVAQAPDGQLDSNFGGGDGVFKFAAPDHDLAARDVDVDFQGRILVAGSAFDKDTALMSGQTRFFAARLTPRGGYDDTFGERGRSIIDFPHRFQTAETLLQEGPRVVVGGTSENSDAKGFALASVVDDSTTTRHGTLDRNFSGDGLLVDNFGGDDRSSETVQALGFTVRGGERRLIAAGTLNRDTNPPATRIALASYYTHTGRPDLDFGRGGSRIIRVTSTSNDQARAMVIQAPTQMLTRKDGRPTYAPGKIVIAGSTIEPGRGQRFLLMRFNLDGSRDESFGGGDGVTTTSFPDIVASRVNALAIDAEGRLVAAGLGRTTTGRNAVVVARYTPDGIVDTSFGNTVDPGEFVLPGISGYAKDVAVTADGKIVVVGGFGSDHPGADRSEHFNNDGVVPNFNTHYFEASHRSRGFLIARLTERGEVDRSFDFDGVKMTSIGTYSRATALHLPGDGSAIVAGDSGRFGGNLAVVARYKNVSEGPLPRAR